MLIKVVLANGFGVKSSETDVDKEMVDKIKFDNITNGSVEVLQEPSYNNIMKVAIDYSDAIIKGSKDIPNELEEYLNNANKPVLDYYDLDSFSEPYTEFYNTQVLS